MHSRTAALLFASGLLTSGTALAQTPLPNPLPNPTPNPTQQPISAAREQVPVFRITVVGRTTRAINYRPRSGETRVDFSGTALMPQGRGSAKVSGEKGYMRIDARFDELQPPTSFGREYLTYVLWAVTPEGRASNLGEIQVDDNDARVEVTTQLQAFGLIVTAEPYFAVTQPSDVVVMENVVRDNTKGRSEVIQAKYELLTRGSYLMNQDAARLKIKPLEPGSPLDLAEARNAVELARLAGADRYASDTFDKAGALLATAEEAREKHRGSNAIQMAARQAVQTAEDSRLVGLQRQEEAFKAEERRISEAREHDANVRAEAEAARRRQAELDARNEAAARASAEQNAQAAAAQQAEAARAKADADAARAAADTARAAAESARAEAETARRDAEGEAFRAKDAAAQSEREKAELRDSLRTQLNLILETRETARGLIVNVSDVLFDTGKADLKPGAREKLARISGILGSHPGLALSVEGHTDSVGSAEFNQQLSERRAESVRGYLVGQQIAPASVAAIGLGEDHPVASNDTASGRQQNRRVEIIVSGEPIGTR
jgi:outer membrane protein OmpA-like peptidoglycan-associated protein